jgi:hypothetical protein
MTHLKPLLLILSVALAPTLAQATMTCGPMIDDQVCVQVGRRLQGAPRFNLHLGVPGDVGLGSEGFAIDAEAGTAGELKIRVFSNSARGGNYGAYALLQKLGFRFLHPLEPITPSAATIAKALENPSLLHARETPAFEFRGVHLHTQHPIELTNLLTGWGTDTEWNALLPEWESYLEWLTAHRQNHVEWMPLDPKRGAQAARGFFSSRAFQDRLRRLVDRAHAWGLRVGVDVPIAFEQQNAWRLVPSPGRKSDPIEQELIQIRSRLSFILAAGFDFISTEMGISEFTAPDEHRMLAWLNEFTRVVADEHGREAFTKVHISTGQLCKDFKDPRTGAPLNFNYLPYFAHPQLQVLPHTVQAYAADDFAPTYGNTDFMDMLGFGQISAQSGRGTVWYPETAYWVSTDVDVPLFLPVYGLQRVRDLRLISEKGIEARGQMLFSSGWEHGYWLNDLVAVRAAWNPHAEKSTDDDAFHEILEETLGAPNSESSRPSLVDWLTDLGAVQKRLFIHGVPGAKTIESSHQLAPGSLTGFAYLMGVETWDEVSFAAARLAKMTGVRTQPERVGLRFKHLWKQLGPVRTLLSSMESELSQFDQRLAETNLGALAGTSYDFELRASMKLLALRAKFIRELYRDQLDSARRTALEARPLARESARRYRTDPARIAGWGLNPTAYSFGYLWTARTLYYWWRDLRISESPWSRGICFGNVIDPLELALGKGELHSRLESIQNVVGDVSACLRIPKSEPKLWE